MQPRLDAAARRAAAARDAYYDSLPTVMVMEEMPTPRESHILLSRRRTTSPARR